MPFTRSLPGSVLQVLADQIAERTSSPEPLESFITAPDTNAESVPSSRLTESFVIWNLIPDVSEELESGERNLSLLARNSGVWHHQIRQDGQATAFARSKPLGPDPEDWSLREVVESPLAQRIDEGIAFADHEVPPEVEVRLLSISFQQVEAFWFVTAPGSEHEATWNDRILVLSAPARLQQLVTKQIITAREFLDALSTPVRGIGLIPGDR